MSWNRILLVLIVVASLGLAAGCGDDEEDGDTTDVSVPTISVPTDVEGAEEAQEQATSIATEARSQAYDACVDAANRLPESQKSEALEACEKVR